MTLVKIIEIMTGYYWWIETGDKLKAKDKTTGGKDFPSVRDAERDAEKKLGEVKFVYEPKELAKDS